MPTCRLCKHTFRSLKFQTEHIDICTRCVNTLNESPEPARKAQERLAEMLARGMRRNAERDLESAEEWKRLNARSTIENFDKALEQALPAWITKLLSKDENSTRDFKIMRAHRRGLLRMVGFAEYPSNWSDVAHSVRVRDRMCCTECGTIDAILDVHHIVYLSKHGTNQKSNLVTLCRPCHQEEHGREFDWAEEDDPESLSPIQPPLGQLKPITKEPPPTIPHPPEPISDTAVVLSRSRIEADLAALLNARKRLTVLIQEKQSITEKAVQEAKGVFTQSLEPWLKTKGHKAGLGYAFIWFVGTAFLFIGGYNAKDSALIFSAVIGFVAYMFTANGPRQRYMESDQYESKLQDIEKSVSAQMHSDQIATTCPGCGATCNVVHAEHTISTLLTCSGCKRDFRFQDFINEAS